MAPRRNYNKIPFIDKTRLRESFNRGEDLFINIPETQLLGRSLKLYRFEMVKKIIKDQADVIDTAKC